MLQRNESVNFSWSDKSPGPGVNKDKFSVRWSGMVKAPSSGKYRFRTVANDGVRLWVNGVRVVNNWANRTSTATNTTQDIALSGGKSYAIVMEYYDNTGAAVARLKWRKPGQTTYVMVPSNNLSAN